MTDRPRALRIQVGSGSLGITGSKVGLWVYGTYAPAWFADAQQEAKDQARRREILFAVCAVESYLVEWVRDQVLKKDLKHLGSYFPPNQRIGIVDRWKKVIDHLHKDSTIPRKPSYGESYWKDFTDLVDLRNGLVHGIASKPERVTEEEKPKLTAVQLQEIHPGWAVKVAANVIRKLHDAVGTSPPKWISS